jgi:hypothetical protein
MIDAFVLGRVMIDALVVGCVTQDAHARDTPSRVPNM